MKTQPVLLSSFSEFLGKQRRIMKSSAFFKKCTQLLGHEPQKSEMLDIWIVRYARAFHLRYEYPTIVA